jgi:hypothetical protein
MSGSFQKDVIDAEQSNGIGVASTSIALLDPCALLRLRVRHTRVSFLTDLTEARDVKRT